MAKTETQAAIFEFTGNRLCLDFINTLQDRATSPGELLKSYKDLVSWARQGQLLTDDEAQHLRQEGTRRGKAAKAVLQEAIDLRETMYRIFFALVEDASPARDDLLALNAGLAKAMSQVCIVPTQGGFAWDWQNKEKALDCMLWPVIRSASDLLTSRELEDVRVCAADDCNWLFLDTSKNHTRRWCDMKSCGNRAKARKHYTQKKQDDKTK